MIKGVCSVNEYPWLAIIYANNREHKTINEDIKMV